MAEQRNFIQPGNEQSSMEVDPKEDGMPGEPRPFAAPIEASPEYEIAGAPAASLVARVAPALAVSAIVAWSVFYGWAIAPELPVMRADPRSWAGIVSQWAVPVLLVGVIWLVAMRHSRAEAGRFADAAFLLRQESESLEQRLKVMNRELSLAREFLGTQSQELEVLGRVSAERIAKHADALQAMIRHNGEEVNTIATTSQTALGNMNALRDNLPVVTNSIRDAANQIGNAGRGAQEQVDRLIAAFERLNQFGTASGAQVQSLEARIGHSIGSFVDQVTRVEALFTERFAQLQTESAAFRAEVTALEEGAVSAFRERSHEVAAEAAALNAKLQEAEDAARARFREAFETLHFELLEKLRLIDEADRATGDASEKRLAQLRGELEQLAQHIDARTRHFAEQLEQRQAAFEMLETQASEMLAQRLSELDDDLAQRREAQIAESEKLVAQSAAMSGQLDQLLQLIGRATDAGSTAGTQLQQALGTLGEQLVAKQQVLAETQSQLATITDASVRLLEIIQSGARFAREDLAVSITGATDQLASAEDKASMVQGLMLQSTGHGQLLESYLIQTREQIILANGALAELDAAFAGQSEDALARLAGLRGGFARLADESDALAEQSQERLRSALEDIEAAIKGSLATLDDSVRGKLGALAATLGSDAVAALERALRNEAAVTIGKLEQAASHASGVGREATVQLRDQLAMVNELTGNLEQRIARARELAEEQVNNDFARRMALITDSLNSAAIDISGAISSEVSDTAWEAYLKGDRGIFTRRAVRLIDPATSREIAEMYQRDDAFKANVGRYIHDFEAMLRSVLSTRNGNVLGVTMLGSDMGKLYVALAQAIQRFRT